MKLIEQAVASPVKVAVGVILLVMFGILSLFGVPVQLAPNIDRPTISVRTNWPGASPQEIEREIVEPQEKQLKSLEGMVRMSSESRDSQSEVTLEFLVGTDMSAALLKVNNKLQQVPSYPPTAEKPVIISASEQARPIAYMVITPTRKNAPPVEQLRTFVIERVIPYLERVPGVALANVYGGRDTEMQVVVQPQAVAANKLTMGQIAAALKAENRDVSAGGLNEGKRRYTVRTASRLTSPEEAEKVVAAYRAGAPITIADLGRARIGYSTEQVIVRQFGERCLVLNAIRETGANVLTVMAGIKDAIGLINKELLQERGYELNQVYDETEYINQAIDLVVNNIYIGGALAMLVLILFLRSISTTVVIAVAIPISLLGTFIMMGVFGRTINVISLAGLAFASGMVVDNAIVVLENIYRRRQLGESGVAAATKGATQVWGAVLASTLTTVAVFLPIVRVREEAGQLFADIAIAVSFAVLISLVVAITVIPSLAARMVGRVSGKQGFWFRLGGVAPLAGRLKDWVAAFVYAVTGRLWAKALVVILLTGLSLGAAAMLAPKAEYLPEGNRNLVLAIILPPPGYSPEQTKQVGARLVKKWRDRWGEKPGQAQGAKLEPAIKTFFYVGRGAMIFTGLATHDPARVRELIPVMKRDLAQIPGMIPIVKQTSLFSHSLAGGRSIDLELTGPDLNHLVKVAQELFGQVRQVLPGCQVRPIPGLDLGQPEMRFVPDRVRAAAVGLTAGDIGLNLNVLVEGAKIDEVSREGVNIDLKLMAASNDRKSRTQDLGLMQINTADGGLVTLNSVAPPRLVAGPTQINRVERMRAITLQIMPPASIPLEEAMEKVTDLLLKPLKKTGQLNPPYGAALSGTADNLTKAYRALEGNFLLALAITFLLMAALFESFLYPLVVMFSVPLAAAGGFGGLWLVNRFIAPQAMDVLTMLGFVILVGIVVNNAILLVHQTLAGIREDGLTPRDAIREAVSLRVRPIFMSTLTSVFAMLPLVLYPGPGSELYRGLGSVVVGGLLVSTVFTLLLVPSLLSLVLDARVAIARWRGKPAGL